jgi:hypothetical protein
MPVKRGVCFGGQPPLPAFKVPIVVEAKRGERFGEIK